MHSRVGWVGRRVGWVHREVGWMQRAVCWVHRKVFWVHCRFGRMHRSIIGVVRHLALQILDVLDCGHDNVVVGGGPHVGQGAPQRRQLAPLIDKP